ncbi:MAG: flagellin lysine-N-methylase [Clostridia bacterium]|nr:flagellin lysine-N-methylase [Clostridia bacterium]
MLFVTPSYYKKFRCIADRCSDNCCIGWEIDIDPDTAAYYRAVGGAFGERLQRNISSDSVFILQNERCPFLNDKNLCDIMITCGEEHLCQICRDHPRFFEWYADRKEGGVGLSCEEAARLILTTDTETYDVTEVDEEPEETDAELFSFLCNHRERLLNILQADGLSVADKFCEILLCAQAVQESLDGGPIASVADADRFDDLSALIQLFADFEPIDATWTMQYNAVRSRQQCTFAPCTKEEEAYLVNLCRYFLWRYFLKGVFDGEVLSKVKFAVVSALFIRIMCDGKTDLHTWVNSSKLYSKQMEYSDENRDLFYDYTYEKDVLTVQGIKQLIRSVLM